VLLLRGGRTGLPSGRWRFDDAMFGAPSGALGCV
jgi:hypothetical protein